MQSIQSSIHPIELQRLVLLQPLLLSLHHTISIHLLNSSFRPQHRLNRRSTYLRPRHGWHQAIDLPQIPTRLHDAVLPLVPLISNVRFQDGIYAAHEAVCSFFVRTTTRASAKSPTTTSAKSAHLTRPFFPTDKTFRRLDGAEKDVDVECRQADACVYSGDFLGEQAFCAGGSECGGGVVYYPERHFGWVVGVVGSDV
jgi:hypothetical protein